MRTRVIIYCSQHKCSKPQVMKSPSSLFERNFRSKISLCLSITCTQLLSLVNNRFVPLTLLAKCCESAALHLLWFHDPYQLARPDLLNSSFNRQSVSDVDAFRIPQYATMARENQHFSNRSTRRCFCVPLAGWALLWLRSGVCRW